MLHRGVLDMSFLRRLMEFYFDLVYNPVYDFTTARTSSYHRLQMACIDKFRFEGGDRLLCVGVGTGNEMLRILEKGHEVSMVGVDNSRSALRRAQKKALKMGERIDFVRMDAHQIGFHNDGFDRVFSHHLMGFLDDDKKATREMLRVLNTGGQFVITYPSGSGGLSLVSEVGRSILNSIRSGKCRQAFMEFLALTGAAAVNIPIAFWVRPKQGFYSYQDLQRMFADLRITDCEIQEDSVYQDFIVYGRKP